MPHNGERSRTVATSAGRTPVRLAADSGGLGAWACDRLVLGRDKLVFTVVGLRKRGTNPRFQLGRQRSAPTQHLAEMGGVQSHPWGKLVDDQLAPSNLGTQIACRVIGRGRLSSHSGPSLHHLARDAHYVRQV